MQFFPPTTVVLWLSIFAVLASASGYAQEEPPEWSAPPLEQASAIRDGRTHEVITFDRLLADLAKCDAVFLGELHTDETTHRFELATYEGLLARRSQKVVLALEMFERNVQDVLNDYLAGKIDEDAFLAAARPWGNYHEAYRPLIELARQVQAPVVASNFPSSLAMRIAREGPGVLDSLPDDQRRLIPQKFYANTPAYWKRVDNAVRGHQGMTASREDDDERLYSIQSLWDNAMGDACARALEQYPGYLVLHVNGEFHSAFWDGAVRQLQLRRPQARVKTVEILPVLNPATAEVAETPEADYLVLVESRATNLDQDQRSVEVGQKLHYRFHLPDGASPESPAPLLIWLPDDGLTAEEGMALWKERVGPWCAVAVVDAPYKEVTEDLAEGGRWYWPESFTEDTLKLRDGIEEMWAYLLRHFPVDPQHVCLAGEGAGATVAVLAAVHTDHVALEAVALSPRDYAKLKDVPLPEYYGDETPPARTLCVWGSAAEDKWWQGELQQYETTGMKCRYVVGPDGPWESSDRQERLIGKALGREPPAVGETGRRKYLLVDGDSPREMHWGRLQASWLSKAEGVPVAVVTRLPQDKSVERVDTQITTAAVAKPGVLPECPGPFGGTTVLVLPDGLSPEERNEWRALEDRDPLAAASRFHRLRIAASAGDHALGRVLEALRAKGRKNVLIVPAVFYADLDWLRSLKRSARDDENTMTLHWLPGLGGRRGVLAGPASPE